MSLICYRLAQIKEIRLTLMPPGGALSTVNRSIQLVEISASVSSAFLGKVVFYDMISTY